MQRTVEGKWRRQIDNRLSMWMPLQTTTNNNNGNSDSDSGNNDNNNDDGSIGSGGKEDKGGDTQTTIN